MWKVNSSAKTKPSNHWSYSTLSSFFFFSKSDMGRSLVRDPMPWSLNTCVFLTTLFSTRGGLFSQVHLKKVPSGRCKEQRSFRSISLNRDCHKHWKLGLHNKCNAPHNKQKLGMTLTRILEITYESALREGPFALKMSSCKSASLSW